MSRTEIFHPDPLLVGFWALLLGSPALVTGYLYLQYPPSETLAQFLWTLLLPLIPIIFAYRFKVSFTPIEFVYRRWGRTARVPYNNIASVEVTNRTPITKEAIGAFIVTKTGERIPFWPKLFPRRAVDRFFALASSANIR